MSAKARLIEAHALGIVQIRLFIAFADIAHRMGRIDLEARYLDEAHAAIDILTRDLTRDAATQSGTAAPDGMAVVDGPG